MTTRTQGLCKISLGPSEHSSVLNTSIIAHIDALTVDGVLKGWAVDRSQPDGGCRIAFSVDDRVVGEAECTIARDDVVRSGLATGPCGFEVHIPLDLLDGAPRVLRVLEMAGRPLWLAIGGEIGTTCRFSGTAASTSAALRSHIDGVRGGSIHGWAYRTGSKPVEVVVMLHGVEIGRALADVRRPDVAAAHGWPDRCGFVFGLPPSVRGPGRRRLRLFALPDMRELEGSPVTADLPDDREASTIERLIAEIDGLHREVTSMRRRARSLLPGETFSLATYDAWARRYFPALRRRVAARRSAFRPCPRISVVMPVYRPLLGDFTAAVESVIGQTHANWELILADDHSQMPELSAQMAAFAARDPRIRVITRSANGGISRATNAALEAATGDWIAYMDHDDLLVDVALEVMAVAAAQPGIRVIYSDEDKIDADGLLSDPAFKPDWNHRYAMGVNYVCHLLMVERETARGVGALDPACDGAQDHDLVLRLWEHVGDVGIHHVREVLYHWRKTPGSTAVDTGNKAYAAAAGIRAVSNHLRRLGRPAVVTGILDTTFYRVQWAFTASPTVSIIIPYRDRIDMTRACVERLLRVTDYRGFDVILVDNWSESEGARRFAMEVQRDPRVRVMRVEEDFNYSRLNNLAAAETDAEFLMLMNNDLFVEHPDWLRVVVNEALADPSVGIVGGKFLYPDRSVQHGGVAMGIGGVAGHVHTDLDATAPGYGARAVLAQELSAVTGAAMLVRADVFREVHGLDEKHLRVAFNDIDLCLKVRAAGRRIIWTPDFQAEHRESVSRGSDAHPEKEGRVFDEIETMRDRWGDLLLHDPFYHPCFSSERMPFHDLEWRDDDDAANGR